MPSDEPLCLISSEVILHIAVLYVIVAGDKRSGR